MRYTDPRAMLEAARSHAEAHQHEIIRADTARELLIGFACVDCPATEETVWECRARDIRQMRHDDPLRDLFFSGSARQALAASLSRGESFFEFGHLDGGITPEEQTRLEGMWDTLPAVDWELLGGDGDERR